MMRNNDCKEIRSGVFKKLRMMLFGLVAMVTAGCGSGGSGDGVIIAVLPLEGSLKLAAVFTDTGQTTGGFVFNFGPRGSRPPIAGEGADISAYQSLKFSIDTSAVPDFANLTIRLESPGVAVGVNLANYVPSVSRTWNSYEIPLSDFPGLDLTDTIFLGFWDARDSLDVLVFGLLDFDDIHFVDAAGVTLAVYSETNIDLVLFYTEIINGDDPLFSGNTTFTLDSLSGQLLPLPTDLVLNLACGNAGVYRGLNSQDQLDPTLGDPTCILDDPENPFRTASIPEFDANNPDAPTKFDLLPPAGPDPCAVPPDPPAGDPSYMPLGEKAEFYYWATALARRPSGENQYYTARALHKLWSVNTDPIVLNQTKRAYRSVLDNFFNDPTFFSTRDFNPNCAEPELFYAVQVKDLTGVLLYEADPPEFMHLYPGLDPLLNGFRALSDMADWGYGFDTVNELVFKFIP